MRRWGAGSGHSRPLGGSEQKVLICHVGMSFRRLSQMGTLLISFFLASSVGAAPLYRSQRVAHAAASRALQKLTEEARRIISIQAKNSQLSDEYNKVSQEVFRLAAEKRRVLRELQQGLYCSVCNRSASEIERQMKVPFRKHLDDVSGIGIPAPLDQIAKKRAEFDRKIQSIRMDMARMEAKHQQFAYEVSVCYHEQERARLEYQQAIIWQTYLAAVASDIPIGTSGHHLAPPSVEITPELAAGTFGLKWNNPSSGYGRLRIYWKNGQVETATPGLSGDPRAMKDLRGQRSTEYPSVGVRVHEGIDFSSRGDLGRAKPQPFTAGFAGEVTRAGGGKMNLVAVRLDNGNTLEFLHASKVSVKVGQKVTPETELGLTGGVGAGGTIHLHVQAKDRDNHSIDPRVAVLKGYDIRAQIYQEAQRRTKRRQTPVPVLSWPVAPILPVDDESDVSQPVATERATHSKERPFIPIP
jgi:murein DD-endopeptidase MepM/ murein hydrolase activator NlpD